MGGKLYLVVVVGAKAVEGVGGSSDAERLCEGLEMGTAVFRRMTSGAGASFDRLYFVSEKPGRARGNTS